MKLEIIEIENMKKDLLLLLGISLLSSHLALAQDASQNSVPVVRTGSLPRFDLDFPGGTAKELVNAITKATGKPLNAVIPENDADWKVIPALSVKSVTAAELFGAFTPISKETKTYPGGYQRTSSWGFHTEGAPNENSIWSFYSDEFSEVEPPTICRFYQLAPYLEAGYKVEDITTAMQTAWKMLGVDPQPAIKYHQDTKLLIAVGAEDKLKMIDDALAQLSKTVPKPKPASSPNGDVLERTRIH
jgi:hypothetical protein